MNVPQSQNLHSQSFNSEFIEFVWRFDNIYQVIFQVRKDGTLYLEAGQINEYNNYVDDNKVLKYDALSSFDILMTEMPECVVGKIFSMCDDLEKLKDESIEYLK